MNQIEVQLRDRIAQLEGALDQVGSGDISQEIDKAIAQAIEKEKATIARCEFEISAAAADLEVAQKNLEALTRSRQILTDFE